MGDREFHLWQAYRYKYGPLNPVRMYDHGAAIVAAQVNNGNRGKAKPRDFMPYGRDEEVAEVVTRIEDFAKFNHGVKLGKRG